MKNKLTPKELNDLIGVVEYKLRRLDELSSSSDQNELIECGGIIRDLIISDHNGLLGMMAKNAPIRSRTHRRIEFTASHEASKWEKHSDTGMWFLQDGLEFHPDAPLQSQAKRYGRDRFLALPVIEIGETVFSLKDVVQFVANKLGGRHFSRDRNETNVHPALYELHDQFTVGGMSPAVRTMQGISRVVYRTGKELVERAKASLD